MILIHTVSVGIINIIFEEEYSQWIIGLLH